MSRFAAVLRTATAAAKRAFAKSTVADVANITPAVNQTIIEASGQHVDAEWGKEETFSYFYGSQVSQTAAVLYGGSSLDLFGVPFVDSNPNHGSNCLSIQTNGSAFTDELAPPVLADHITSAKFISPRAAAEFADKFSDINLDRYSQVNNHSKHRRKSSRRSRVTTNVLQQNENDAALAKKARRQATTNTTMYANPYAPKVHSRLARPVA